MKNINLKKMSLIISILAGLVVLAWPTYITAQKVTFFLIKEPTECMIMKRDSALKKELKIGMENQIEAVQDSVQSMKKAIDMVVELLSTDDELMQKARRKQRIGEVSDELKQLINKR